VVGEFHPYGCLGREKAQKGGEKGTSCPKKTFRSVLGKTQMFLDQVEKVFYGGKRGEYNADVGGESGSLTDLEREKAMIKVF